MPWQISLNHNNINLVPPSIGELSNLRSLRLAHNRIINLPPTIGPARPPLPAQLFLRGARSRARPSVVVPLAGDLKKLKGLYLDFNKLSRLPEEIGGLTLLEDFNLEDNVLVRLPTVRLAPSWESGCGTRGCEARG